MAFGSFLESKNAVAPFQGTQQNLYNAISGRSPSVDYSATPEEVNARQKFDEAQTYQTGLSNQAKSYRANLPGTQNALANQSADVGKRNLAQNIAQTRSNASSRGLLNSGLRQGAEAGNYGSYLSGQSQARSGINQETEQNAQGMENNAISAGEKLQQQRQAMEDAIYGRQQEQYQNALQQQQQRTGLLGGIGKSLGGMAGGALGSAGAS